MQKIDTELLDLWETTKQKGIERYRNHSSSNNKRRLAPDEQLLGAPVDNALAIRADSAQEKELKSLRFSYFIKLFGHKVTSSEAIKLNIALSRLKKVFKDPHYQLFKIMREVSKLEEKEDVSTLVLGYVKNAVERETTASTQAYIERYGCQPDSS